MKIVARRLIVIEELVFLEDITSIEDIKTSNHFASRVLDVKIASVEYVDEFPTVSKEEWPDINASINVAGTEKAGWEYVHRA